MHLLCFSRGGFNVFAISDNKAEIMSVVESIIVLFEIFWISLMTWLVKKRIFFFLYLQISRTRGAPPGSTHMRE